MTSQLAEFNVSKVVKLGTGVKDGEGFRKALEGKGISICKDANVMLSQPDFTAAAEYQKASIALISITDLGFGREARLGEIFSRAQERGLKLCPAEVGPQMRLQYTTPKDAVVAIGMKPPGVMGTIFPDCLPWGLICIKPAEIGSMASTPAILGSGTATLFLPSLFPSILSAAFPKSPSLPRPRSGFGDFRGLSNVSFLRPFGRPCKSKGLFYLTNSFEVVM
jgi:hypothetical protein